MDRKQLMLHELLQQDQEPFHLNAYISDKRSQLNYSPSPAALLLVPETSTHNPCFFSEVTTPPFLDFLSPAISSCGSPSGGAFLHVPSRTAAVLVKAAMRIQKQRQSKPKTHVGLSMLGSCLKILKHRSKNSAVMDCDLQEKENSEVIRPSCSCNRLCIDDLQIFHDKGDFELQKSRFCSCPLLQSPSSSRPATSPFRRRLKQENRGGNVKGAREQREQCSPVSVLDTFFEDESVVGVEDDHDADRSYAYAKIERATQQLMARLRRFEKLASLDPVGLEQKLLEASDLEYQKAGVEFEGDRLCKEVGLEASGVKKRLVGMVEVDMMVKSELGEWLRFGEVVEETAVEIESAILGRLMEELSDELCCMDPQH